MLQLRPRTIFFDSRDITFELNFCDPKILCNLVIKSPKHSFYMARSGPKYTYKNNLLEFNVSKKNRYGISKSSYFKMKNFLYKIVQLLLRIGINLIPFKPTVSLLKKSRLLRTNLPTFKWNCEKVDLINFIDLSIS